MPPVVLSQRRQTAIIVVVALIIALGFAATQLAETTATQLAASQAQVADLQQRLAKQNDLTEPTLTDAMLLLPPDAVVTGGTRLSDGLYWVSAETVDANDVPAEQSWAVDVPASSVSLLVQRSFPEGDVAASADLSSVADGYATIETDASQDGQERMYMDIIDVRSGSLAASIGWEDGASVSVAKEGDRLDLTLPADICKGHRSGDNVTVAGLDVNNTLVKFPTKRTVQCIEDAFTNMIRPDQLGIPLYIRDPDAGTEAVEFTLPGSEDVAHVDLTDLDPQGVTFISQ